MVAVPAATIPTRRLAAIFVADVVGFSRLVGLDEEGTLARLRAIRAELVDPKIGEWRGRIFKTTGDGLLAEFGSVVDAVRCASAIQGRMGQRNAAVAAENRFEFRVGVHHGDVVAQGDDLMGDGVNIAARLQALAEPGGICVSARVQEDVDGNLEVSFEDLGDQRLKNIGRPVRVYRVHPGRVPPESPATGSQPPGTQERRHFTDRSPEELLAFYVGQTALQADKRMVCGSGPKER
jgi:adenylate cyclase